MDIERSWEKALRHTEIVRARVRGMLSHDLTHVPYVFLAESSVNVGDTVVRSGEVVVDKPSLLVPANNPAFYGFDFDTDGGNFNENTFINFLLVRGVSIPSLRYNNQTVKLDVFDGRLSSAIEHYKSLFQRMENTTTGLIVGPEDCWQFSLLIFICSQVARNAQQDIRRLLEEYHRKNDGL